MKYGNLSAKVTKVAISWMATLEVIEKAIENKADFIIHHEPLYYTHYDDNKTLKSYPAGRKKTSLLRKHGIAVYRAHDCWDFYPKYGIFDAWLEQLQIFELVPKLGVAMCRTKPMKFKELILIIKKKMGLENVILSGNIEKKVESAWLAQGSMGMWGVHSAIKSKADCLIAGELSEWESVRYARDSGLTFAIVGHCASENAGMKKMAELLSKKIPGPEYFFIDAGHPFLIT